MKRIVGTKTQLYATLLGAFLAVSGFAHAGDYAAAVPRTPEKLKKGSLKISATIGAGDVRLGPGQYEVKPMWSPAGPVIRFTRVTYNSIGDEWSSFVYDREERAFISRLPFVETEVVAEVKVTIHPLARKAMDTELELSTDGSKAVALQIRGSGIAYLF